MHHVLHHLEEQLSGLALGVIVGTALCIHIRYLLIVAALRGTDFADAFQQVVKIVLTKVLTLLQPFIVEHKALDDVFFQNGCCPDTELRSLITVHTIAYGNDSVEVIHHL